MKKKFTRKGTDSAPSQKEGPSYDSHLMRVMRRSYDFPHIILQHKRELEKSLEKDELTSAQEASLRRELRTIDERCKREEIDHQDFFDKALLWNTYVRDVWRKSSTTPKVDRHAPPESSIGKAIDDNIYASLLGKEAHERTVEYLFSTLKSLGINPESTQIPPTKSLKDLLNNFPYLKLEKIEIEGRVFWVFIYLTAKVPFLDPQGFTATLVNANCRIDDELLQKSDLIFHQGGAVLRSCKWGPKHNKWGAFARAALVDEDAVHYIKASLQINSSQSEEEKLAIWPFFKLSIDGIVEIESEEYEKAIDYLRQNVTPWNSSK